MYNFFCLSSNRETSQFPEQQTAVLGSGEVAVHVLYWTAVVCIELLYCSVVHVGGTDDEWF